MSRHGYHWPAREEPRVVPCFKCGQGERLEGHTICGGCHCEERCATCWPERNYTAPNDMMRGVLEPDRTRGFVV
jgi:hypothetical protein